MDGRTIFFQVKFTLAFAPNEQFKKYETPVFQGRRFSFRSRHLSNAFTMTTKALKRPSSSSVVAETKREKPAKLDKKSKKAKKEPEPEPESMTESESEQEEFSEAESIDRDMENAEVGNANGETVGDAVNPKHAWMTKEQLEEKKKTQREDQKRVRMERKMSKPGYELIIAHRADWDIARRLDTPKDDRAPALERLFAAFTGKFRDLILKHEGSRVVQTCVKHGSPEQRRQIALELRGCFPDVACNKYGKHIVTKLLLYCPDQRESIMSEFSGRVAKSMRHKEASHVIEAIFSDYANNQRKQKIIQEFYGPEFALFKRDQAVPLATVIAEQPDKRAGIAKSLEEHLSVLLNKGSLGLTLVHRLILEYLDAAEFTKAQEWINGISEFLPEIVHTLDGARAVAKCIAMAPSKDRKAIAKSFKPFVEKICKDDRGFQTMISIFALVDDTVLVGKTLLSEVVACVSNLLKDRYGSKVLGYLVCGVNSRLLPPQTVQLLREVRDLARATSKKDDAVRHEELRAQILPAIISGVEFAGGALVRDIESAVFLSELLGALPEAEQQSALFRTVYESIGPDAAFQPGPKCEFLKKSMKIGTPAMATILLDSICEDLSTRATGEGAYMLMHMLRFEEDLAPRIRKLQSKLKKLGGEPIAALLRRMDSPPPVSK